MAAAVDEDGIAGERAGGVAHQERGSRADVLDADRPALWGARERGFVQAVEMANAFFRGVTSIPKHIPTGYAIITRDNMTDPNISKFFYK